MDLLSFRKNVFGLICLAITVGILAAGLWPFNFFPENKVTWLKNQNGVEFYGQSLVYSNIPFFQPSDLSTGSTAIVPAFQHSNIPVNSISIDLCLQSTTEESPHLGHIFSFFDEHGSEIFFIGQWRSYVLLGKGIHGKKNYREMGIRDVLKKGDKRFVTITSGVDGTNIYVDGILMKSTPKFHLFSMNEKPLGRIVLGNSPKGNEYWTGNLLSLAIYDRALTGEEISQHFHDSKKSGEGGPVSLYLFGEHSGTLVHDSVGDHHLVIPSRFAVLKKTILVPPWEDFRFTRSYLMDILTNILGFIPFGFFLPSYLWIRKPTSPIRLLLKPIIIAGCISLTMELIQVYLPTRSSQLMDVITNIAGTALGVILFYFCHQKKQCN